MREGSAIKSLDSPGPRCLSSSVPFEPKRCGVRGYLTKSSRVAPIILSPVYIIQRKGASFASLSLQRHSPTNGFQSCTPCGFRMSAETGNSFGARGTESSFKPASRGRRSALRWFTSLADQTRFSQASLPPRERGTTWSRLPSFGCSTRPVYWQRLPSRSRMALAHTRLGVEALIRQLYRQTLACGWAQAQEVLVIADGALWIWNAVQDRFPDARQRLDLYHADEHLWAVAHDLYGQGTPEARQWVAPLLKQLRNDHSPDAIQTLNELQPALSQALQKKVQTQIEYFESHQNRMHYRENIKARKALAKDTATETQRLKANEPLGSGAIVSTCRQYQCRFKRTGQFWSAAGDEALMCLETFWRNGRWHELYPHAKLASPSLN